MTSFLSVLNETRSTRLGDRIEIADNPLKRAIGLLGNRQGLSQGEGLLIRPCSSIHTFWMAFSIDVLFLGADGRVLHLIPNMKSGRISPIIWRSRSVLELPDGTIDQTLTEIDDLLVIS